MCENLKNSNFYCFIATLMNIVLESIYFIEVFHTYHILPCITCTTVLVQTFREKIICFNFLIQFLFIYLTDYHIPGYYFAYGYRYCFLELYF